LCSSGKNENASIEKYKSSFRKTNLLMLNVKSITKLKSDALKTTLLLLLLTRKIVLKLVKMQR